MAPIVFPVGFAVALIAVMIVRHQNRVENKSAERSMTTSLNENSASNLTALEQARKISPPKVSLQKGGEFEHGEWWGEQDAALKDAWKEWWVQSQSSLPELSHKTIIDPSLRKAVETLRQKVDDESEAELQSLFDSVLPQQVYKIPFFTAEGVQQIRQHLDASSYYYESNSTTAAGIPTRRPNGMNRYGIIVDRNIEGAVSYEGINQYIEELVQDYVRPISRMLFPEITSRFHPEDDEEHYAFTIRYRADLDMKLAEHSDASVYTININLNIPDQGLSSDYSGSSLYFVDDEEAQQHVSFTPGMAVLHRGQTRHAALPITEGERHNLVIWLFGRHAYVRIAEYDKLERLSVQERWGT